MPRNSIKVPTKVLIVADILDGYINDDLPESRSFEVIKNYLERADPNKTFSRNLLNSFKGKMIKSAKLLSNKGERLNIVDWGHYRNLHEDKIKSMLTPTIPIGIAFDDVGEAVPPTFPDGTRFTIKYEGLFCQKETRDRNNPFGSDEVYLITSAVTIVNGENIVRTERHPLGAQGKIYHDVDEDEKRVGPIAAVWSGEETTISLIATVMENDEGDPDHYKDQIRIIVGAAAAIASFLGVPLPLATAVGALSVELINWLVGSGDDIIGVSTFVINPELLSLYSINPGTNFSNRNPKIEINQNFTLFHDQSGEYYTMYSVEADREPIEIPDIVIDPRVAFNKNNLNLLKADGLIF